MADGDGGSNTSIVAILAIVVIVLLVAFFVLKGGLFGGRGGTGINVNVSTPGSK
ncbi:MAG: hypothetical protein ABR577_12080 [Pyrinomonadaceae bacterium]